MELWLEIDGETVDFDVTRDGDALLVSRDGVTWTATVEQSGAAYRVTVDGKDYELTRDGEEPRGRGGDRLILERGGATYEVAYAGRKTSKSTGGGEELPADGALFPLMPGTIMEVLVAVGDTVHEGDVLLVLEAMKMQNEISAPVAGTVAEVAVRPGQNVDRKTMMLRIEPEAPGGS
jgi:biotin carboxyl carrier protein